MVLENFGKKMGEKAAGLFGFNADGTRTRKEGPRPIPDKIPAGVPPKPEKVMTGSLTLEEVRKWKCPTIDPEDERFSHHYEDSITNLYKNHPAKFEKLIEHVLVNSDFENQGQNFNFNPKGAKWFINKIKENGLYEEVGKGFASRHNANVVHDRMYFGKSMRSMTPAELAHQNPQILLDTMRADMGAKKIAIDINYLRGAGIRSRVPDPE